MNFLRSIASTVNAVTDNVTERLGPVKGYTHEDLRESPFPVRDGCKITLYQDAHAGDEDGPCAIATDDGSEPTYKPGNAFEEIYFAILNARRFIYITGWSVDTKISLLRRRPVYPLEKWPTPAEGEMLTVGDLLKYKAKQGVHVMIHIWNEALSVNVGNYSLSSGVMNTFDEETLQAFAGSGVEVKLSYRTGTATDNQVLWSHHQKTVIVDAPLEDEPVRYEMSDVEPEVLPEELYRQLKEGELKLGSTLPADDDDDEVMIARHGPNDSGKRFVKMAFMTCEHRYKKIWDDSGTGADPHMLAAFRPMAPDGFFLLGDLVERSHDPSPSAHTKIVVVAEPRKTDPSLPDLLAEPIDFELVWFSEKIGRYGNPISFWRPVAPVGYHALGHVVNDSDQKPDSSSYRCVHESALLPANVVIAGDSLPIWRDKCSGCPFGDVSLWHIRPRMEGMVTGTFIAHCGYKKPAFVKEEVEYFCLAPPPHGIHRADVDYDGIDESEYVASADHTTVPQGLGMVGQRRVIAFVGGLDLTNGRWDSPAHSLFRTLGTEHQSDFMMAWGINPAYGPREPWHDIHGKVEGPIARDILLNFEQRWRMQAHTPLFNFGSEFITAEEEAKLIAGRTAPEELWEARLCRSIDPFSADIGELERGIQHAYMKAIRSAKRFIYVENQYFLGSAAHWPRHSDVECFNVIPFEIATRVAKAIMAGENFMVYILIPYHPEGYPEAKALQEIMRWQHHTQEMMYSIVTHAIKKSDNPDRHPTEFLNFFCLGQRESLEGNTAPAGGPPDPHDTTLLYEKDLYITRRSQIYVHSKLMIVDDDYAIWGSANINDRSMSGNRDTEIAVEAWQPHYRQEDTPRGHIHNFRMSLWAEHAGISDPAFLNPNTPESVELMRSIGDRNLAVYTGAETRDIESHLLRYPIDVTKDGKISCNPEYVPDTKAKLRGAPTTVLPDNLTT